MSKYNLLINLIYFCKNVSIGLLTLFLKNKTIFLPETLKNKIHISRNKQNFSVFSEEKVKKDPQEVRMRCIFASLGVLDDIGQI